MGHDKEGRIKYRSANAADDPARCQSCHTFSEESELYGNHKEDSRGESGDEEDSGAPC